jgi:hypothetical protein
VFIPLAYQSDGLSPFMRTCIEKDFPLRCFQQFFYTNLAIRRCYWHNNRYTIG